VELRTVRAYTAVLLAATVALSVPAAAVAHVQLSPDRVAPGSFTLFTVLSPNESAQPLTGLQLTIPEELLVDSVADTPGFTTKVVEDAQHRVAGLSWEGGKVAPARLALFRFSGTPTADGVLELTGIQHFADGSTQLWHSPQITVAAAGSSSRDSLTLAVAIAALAVSLGLAVGVGVVLVRRARVRL
jgi:uncharacterized protein YcnI